MAKDFLDRLGRTLKEGARVVARESEELARVGKLRLDIAGLAGKRDDLWEEIGKTIYTQFEEGREVPAQVMDLCRRAQEVVEKIKGKEAEIAALRAQEEEKARAEQAGAPAQAAAGTPETAGQCPRCGSPVEPQDRFCRQCGAALK
ncbi:MAG: zinc ribbon domain-containing protein [Bacillota bacterium]|nr:zinc ribbon domain-containing protein [Bacillota bacterium]